MPEQVAWERHVPMRVGFASMVRSKRVRVRRTQVALGASPKPGERCTVSITVDQQMKCALGTLVKVRDKPYKYGRCTLGATRQLSLRDLASAHTGHVRPVLGGRRPFLQ